jgi:Ca2+-binding RTX toxin-like protein
MDLASLRHSPLRLLIAVLVSGALAISAPTVAAAAPSCAEGPQTVGDTIYGTPCDDTIQAPRNITTVVGEGGDDTLYGQRGNDSLFGGDGADRLYGGVGDDRVRGGPGDDRLSGGFGADSLDGEAGDDFARGDATIDRIGDSGGGTDTLSFATGATPGFSNQGTFFDNAGFPADVGRGVYVDLGDDFANNGLAPSGGGVDEPLAPETTFANFETVIGTPFADYIVGTPDAETFYGGGGADLIDGKGGADVAYGGAEGDGCIAATRLECESTGANVTPRGAGTISAGLMAAQSGTSPAVFLGGSSGNDTVVASYSGDTVTLTVGGNPAGSFPLAEPPDSVLVAGLAGDDTLSAVGFPATTSIVLLGGEGGDQLTSGATEDAVIDGAGNDLVDAGGGDDAVPNNGGADFLQAGPGEDLFISNSVCDGDTLDGGPDRDNANWANFGSAVSIDMGAGSAGLVGAGGEPSCPGGLLTTLTAIGDTEGTRFDDVMVGDLGPNQLLGRFGADVYRAGDGNDTILANSGTPGPDPDPAIDCGPGLDTAQIDRTQNGPDAAPTNCEAVEERDPNSFRPPDTPADPEPPDPTPPDPTPPAPPTPDPPAGESPSPSSTQPPVPTQPSTADRNPPQTRIVRRPSGLIPARTGGKARVVLAFTAGERGAVFRCKLDRGAYKPCSSPRAYRVGVGRHTVRIAAIDAAGNRDPSPALFRFRVGLSRKPGA